VNGARGRTTAIHLRRTRVDWLTIGRRIAVGSSIDYNGPDQ
jgi:hypothetical protein